MESRRKDYFSFESYRDKNREVVGYHVTMIGTIEKDGVPKIRSDVKDDGTKMAFGKLTIRGHDRKIQVLLNETNTRVWYHDYNPEESSVDIISFAAKDWRADEVFQLNEGDRVLIEGRAYVRHTSENDPRGRADELSVTATGIFILGRQRKQFKSMNDGLIPQE